MVNFISEIKKMKIFILPCPSNEDSPRKHNSEENWKLLKNMKKVLYTLLSNRVIKGKLNFALSSLVFLYFFDFVCISFPKEQT